MLVYNQFPVRSHSGRWPGEEAGRIHVFSERDAAAERLYDALPLANVVREFTLDPDAPGTWAFQYLPAAIAPKHEDTVQFLVDGIWQQDFCHDLLSLMRMRTLPVNVPLYWAWA